MVSAEDDPYAPRTSVEELIRYYKHIKWTHWHIKPDEILQDEVGHFGFFRKKMSSALWPEIERWISKPFESKENKAA
jgi:predicted alpha/beta hydrolase